MSGGTAELIVADEARLDGVLDSTYPIWGEGLSRDAYGRWNRAQMRTPWGREHLRRVALVADGDVLASAKRYDFSAQFCGRPVEVTGIGAVFTPAHLRGRGHARELVAAMCDDAVRRGAGLALLFSEIGAAYYERLGFRALPQQVTSIDVHREPGAPAMLVRSGTDADLDAIADIAARYADGADFALRRTPALIQFGIARKRLLAGFGPPGTREVEFFVAEEGRRAVAYVVISRSRGSWLIEDCGDFDPAGARVGAMLQVLLARMPAEPAPAIRLWQPRGLRPPQLHVLSTAPAAEILMIRSLDPTLPVSSPGHIHYCHADVF